MTSESTHVQLAVLCIACVVTMAGMVAVVA